MQKFEIFFVMKLKQNLNEKKRKLMEMLSDDVKTYFEYEKKKERKELLFLKYI